MNGYPGVSFIDSINKSTSAGNPWKKSKKYFLKESFSDIHPEGVKPTEEIMSRVEDCIRKYEMCNRYSPVFCAHLKDEPTKLAKCEIGKTRVFTGAPFDWTFVVRKYLLTFARLVQTHRYVFESAPGIIAQSSEWQDLRQYLVSHGEDKLVAGDYAAFDKKMPSTIILAAFDIIEHLCQRAGYTDLQLRVVRGIAVDTAFPLVDFNGDLIEFYGSNPSGHPLTVIINGLANSLYMRYCYAKLSPEKSAINFKKHVSLMTYGDDNVMGVSDDANWFNHTSISNVLGDVGIEYTMADKVSESVPFINISRVSFLKRTWRFDDGVGAYLCPLEVSSIHKMLTSCVISKTITREEQAVAVIETAVREYFFYGKRTFDSQVKFLKHIVDEAGLANYVKDSTFVSWQNLKDSFWDASGNMKIQSESIEMKPMEKELDPGIEILFQCQCCGLGPLAQNQILCDFCFIDIDEMEDVDPKLDNQQFKCSYCRFPEKYESASEFENGYLKSCSLGRSPKSVFTDAASEPASKDSKLHTYGFGCALKE